MDPELKKKLLAYLAKDESKADEDKKEKEDSKAEEAEEAKEEKTDEDIAKDVEKSVLNQLGKIIEKAVKPEKSEASIESKSKASKLGGVEVDNAGDIDLMPEMKQVIYTKKDGTKMEISKSQGQSIKDWYIAVLQKDKEAIAKSYDKLENKYTKKGGLEIMNQTVAADGGVLVPTILANFIVEIQNDEAVMRPNSFNIPMDGMSGNTLDISKELTLPKVQWAGVEQYDADKSTTSAQYEKQTLTPYTLAAMVSITTQLVEDSPFNMPQILARQLGGAMADEGDRVAIQGNGVSQPTGLNSYTPIKTVNAGGLLTFDHMTGVYWGMPQRYRKRAVWVMNSTRIALVQNLKDSNNMPIFQPQLLGNQPPTLMGRPVLENNHVGDDRIYLVNLNYYYYGTKSGIRIRTSDQVTVAGVDHWSRNLINVRGEERYDAELVDTRALGMIQNP